MRPNQLRAILIFLISPITTWLFVGYPYTMGTQKATKISNKNSSFNCLHSLHTKWMNASHSTKVFTNSCDHVSTNDKASLHTHITPQNSSIRSDEGLTLKTKSAFETFNGGNSTPINLFDETKFFILILCWEKWGELKWLLGSLLASIFNTSIFMLYIIVFSLVWRNKVHLTI